MVTFRSDSLDFEYLYLVSDAKKTLDLSRLILLLLIQKSVKPEMIVSNPKREKTLKSQLLKLSLCL